MRQALLHYRHGVGILLGLRSLRLRLSLPHIHSFSAVAKSHDETSWEYLVMLLTRTTCCTQAAAPAAAAVEAETQSLFTRVGVRRSLSYTQQQQASR
jgi:hypothetical protein